VGALGRPTANGYDASGIELLSAGSKSLRGPYAFSTGRQPRYRFLEQIIGGKVFAKPHTLPILAIFPPDMWSVKTHWLNRLDRPDR